MPNSGSTTRLPPGVHLGPTGPRLLAALVEVGPVWLLSGLAVMFGLVLDGPAPAILCALLALAWAVLVWAQRAGRAAGPGMRLNGLQVVGFRDGRPLGWGRVLVRWLVFAGLTVTVVGLIALAVVMARHPRRQGWHDLAAEAVVIKERPLAPRPKQAIERPKASASARPGPARAAERPKASASARSEPSRAAAEPKASSTSVRSEPSRAAARPKASASAPSPRSAARSTRAPATRNRPSKPAPAPAATGTSVADTTVAEQPVPADVVAAAIAAAQPASEEPETAGAPAAEVHRPDLEWWLRLDDGRDVGVDGLVLLGRNPQPRVGEEDATLIKVLDETRTVSKSHLAVGVDARGLYVMDRGSTNGTTVTSPDGDQRPCPPGDLVDVPGGSVISFGDHWLEIRRV